MPLQSGNKRNRRLFLPSLILVIACLFSLGSFAIVFFSPLSHANIERRKFPKISTAKNDNSAALITTSKTIEYAVNESLHASCQDGLLVISSPQQKTCLFAKLLFPARTQSVQDNFGYRLPWFSSTGHLFVQCAAWRFFASSVLNLEEKHCDSLDRLCHKGELSNVMDYLSAARLFISHSPSLPEMSSQLLEFFTYHQSGKLYLRAIQLAHLLTSPNHTQHAFQLVQDEEIWSNLLPSKFSSEAFGDVNTFSVQLPIEQHVHLLIAVDAQVDQRGRVIASRNKHHEVFYHQISPWSFKPLMLIPQGPYRKNMSFDVDYLERERLLSTLSSPSVTDCHLKSRELLSLKKYFVSEPCKQGVAVARLFVISQHLSREMFHFLCESMPRLGAFVDWLKHDPTVFIHAFDCYSKVGYCLSYFEALGIPKSRILGNVLGKVFAGEVFVPSGGRGHWPLANLWGIEALVQETGFVKSSTCSSLSSEKRKILIIKRKSTRLQSFSSSSYDKWKEMIENVFDKVQVQFFDDSDSVMMKTMSSQIQALQWADVLVGAHGAAMSWIPFLKRCSHVVSLRGRTNSDIYEHLALGFGIGFHHAQFKYSLESTMNEIITSVGDALYLQHTSSVKVFAMSNAQLPSKVTSAFHGYSSLNGCNYEKVNSGRHTHYALVHDSVVELSKTLIDVFDSEIERFPLVVFTHVNSEESMLILVKSEYSLSTRECRMKNISDIILSFDYPMLIVKLARRQDEIEKLTCVGMSSPYQLMHSTMQYNHNSSQREVMKIEKISQSVFNTKPVPRDLCKRQDPSAESLGQEGKEWYLKYDNLLVIK